MRAPVFYSVVRQLSERNSPSMVHAVPSVCLGLLWLRGIKHGIQQRKHHPPTVGRGEEIGVRK